MKTAEEIQEKITALEKLVKQHRDLKAKALDADVVTLHYMCITEFETQIAILTWVLNENRS